MMYSIKGDSKIEVTREGKTQATHDNFANKCFGLSDHLPALTAMACNS